MSALDANPAVQVLGMEFDAPYVKETFLFFYAVAVVQQIRQTKNLVHTLAVALLRCFGSYGFLLPLVLGALPSKAYANFDSYMLTLGGAIFTVDLVLSRIPSDVMNWLQYPIDITYSVVKANACGHGYVMCAAALPDSVVAPFVGAYLAVNGHRILEHGIGSFGTKKFDGDALLGIAGGLWYFALIEYVRVSSLIARVFLIVFRISCDYVDYNHLIDQVISASNMGGPAPSKRGRSKTPKRK